MVPAVDWDDVASFVGAYFDQRLGGPHQGAQASLLDELTDAYLAYRSLPASMRSQVMAMVDSVL